MDFSLFLTIVAAAIGFFVIRRFRFNPENNEIDTSSLSPSSPPSSLSSRSLSTSSTPSALSPSSASPSSSSHVWMYDVFPSFRGEDVRYNFLSHIKKEFKRKTITFFNDNGIERGESIAPELIQGIRGSKIAIVLLSTNYASSKWCLEELVEIMKCREELGQTVIAIFYKVDPSDVKKLTGDFGEVFRKTCKGKAKEEIRRWEQALEKVAVIAGYHLSNWDDEATVIENISTCVLNKLVNSPQPSHFDNLVGMSTHMENLELLLSLGSKEVRMVGIWGPSGIGKSTIARVLFNQHSHQFQFSVFMENIKRLWPRPYYDEYSVKLQLQEEFLSRVINQKDIKIQQLGVVEDRLKDKRVLAILDDVDHLLQIEAIAKEARWFGPGSWIIITTQDKRLLYAHGINQIYEVELPPDEEALEIFCMNAFCQKSPPDGFKELAWEVTRLAGKLPLGLRVMGSHFKGRPKHEWEEGLPRLRTRLNGEIENTLKFSYDALCDDNQAIFLHLACFFINEPIENVERCLEKKIVGVKGCLRVLAEKSFISFEWGRIKMHDLLALLGREIVRKQSIHEPGQRQFLVDAGDICQVLRNDTLGSRNVIGIDLDLTKLETEVKISDRVFERMPNVQFLRVKYRSIQRKPYPHSIDPVTCLPPNLIILHWDYFPMTCLPSNFNPEFLTRIILTENNYLEKLWEGNKTIRNLKLMNLSNSKNLKELPDLSTATNLQTLELSGCSSLTELPFSIGNAINLRRLNLSHCSSLMELPSSMENATDLEELNLTGCLHLAKLPSSIGNLKKLYLKDCSSLVEFPSSMENVTTLEELLLTGCSHLANLPPSIGNLKTLYLENCSSLVELPSSVRNSINLKNFSFNGCSNLVELPFYLGNATDLQRLYLRGCSSLQELPSSIGNITRLEELILEECSSLVELPSSIGNITSLEYLNLDACSSLVKLPSSIGDIINLKNLYLNGCSSLVELPSSIGNINYLKKLSLNGCSSLVELPSSIGNMTSLEELNLNGCSSLVELPSSIGNMNNLWMLYLERCSNLTALPININMKSLRVLALTDCSSLKSFPEISTNIRVLKLTGTAIEEIPPSIMSWPWLSELNMSYLENLKKSQHALYRITDLLLSDTGIQETAPWVKKERSRIRELVIKRCTEQVSFPQDCKFCKRHHFSLYKHKSNVFIVINCLKLNQETRDLIIKTSTRDFTILPGETVPTYFSYRAAGSSLSMTWNGLDTEYFPTSLRFRACLLLVYKGHVGGHRQWSEITYCIKDKLTGVERYSHRFVNLPPTPDDHLFVFEIEETVSAPELVFEFGFTNKNWEIKKCGLHPLETPSC
uniref:ADP-ribosyl cyclase/cyclic ADP-ribose hydrolase n=1 Tax=Brassica rapa subsp. pekinensis TaxID=51351 RepID=M5A8J3_BRARP|nr:putative disease resistance protein [Brassica rapa subsp. pekinensis]BAN04701.1 putative disease resistance protein [Brassica rapa subsp. pekinensis]BAW35451.1 clubroot resistance protein [Brassica rapa subsp. pekinensis]